MYTKYDQWLNEAKLESFKTKEEIEAWLKSMEVEDYTINQDLTVDVNGKVDISDKKLKVLPVKFGKVAGSFYCDNNNLTNLQGAPKEVGKDFFCLRNKLTSLQGAPEKVGGGFYCYDNKLTSLQGAPEKVGGDFYCKYNKLTSLQGAPKEVGGNFYCNNNNLTSLDGAPEKVGGNFYCYENPTKFTEDDVKAVSKVKGIIEV